MTAETGIPMRQACRSCGCEQTRAELDAGGYLSCCPERNVNEIIERDLAAYMLNHPKATDHAR